MGRLALAILTCLTLQQLVHAGELPADWWKGAKEEHKCSFENIYNLMDERTTYLSVITLDCQLRIFPLKDFASVRNFLEIRTDNAVNAPIKCRPDDYLMDLFFEDGHPFVLVSDRNSDTFERFPLVASTKFYSLPSTGESRIREPFPTFFYANDKFIVNILKESRDYLLFYADKKATCAFSSRGAYQKRWLKVEMFTEKTNRRLGRWLWFGNGGRKYLRPLEFASFITNLVLTVLLLVAIVCTIVFLCCIRFKRRKFNRNREQIEQFLIECYTGKITDEKFAVEEYKYLIMTLRAGRNDISVTGKRKRTIHKDITEPDASRSKTERRQKLDIPSSAFGGSEKFPTPSPMDLFARTKKKKAARKKSPLLKDEDLQSKPPTDPNKSLQLKTTETKPQVDDFLIEHTPADDMSVKVAESLNKPVLVAKGGAEAGQKPSIKKTKKPQSKKKAANESKKRSKPNNGSAPPADKPKKRPVVQVVDETRLSETQKD